MYLFQSTAEKGVIKFVNVEPCDSDPCTFTSGQEVHLNGVLVSRKYFFIWLNNFCDERLINDSFMTWLAAASNSPQLKVTVKVAGIYFNYPGVSSDACDYLGCPLEADVDTPFALSLKVLSLPLPVSWIAHNIQFIFLRTFLIDFSFSLFSLKHKSDSNFLTLMDQNSTVVKLLLE